jgi:hypothetical protein
MKKSKLLWLSAVLVMSVCTVGCGNNDDELDQSLTVDELSLSRAFRDLPLAIAESFIYMDAFYAPGTSVAVADREGQPIYRLYSPIMSSLGDFYDQQGRALDSRECFDADWKIVLSTSMETNLQNSYPGANQILRLMYQPNSDDDEKLGEFPRWVANKVRASKENESVYTLMVFKGKWRGQTVWFIDGEPAVAPFDPVYNEEGLPIQWSDNTGILDFAQNSSDWQLLYTMLRSFTY